MTRAEIIGKKMNLISSSTLVIESIINAGREM